MTTTKEQDEYFDDLADEVYPFIIKGRDSLNELHRTAISQELAQWVIDREARLTVERDAFKAALEHYADEKNWDFSHYPEVPDSLKDYYVADGHGFKVARQALEGGSKDGNS